MRTNIGSTKIGFTLIGLLVFLGLPAGLTAQEKTPKLNIVFLLADDWRWDTLGCVNPIVQTPNLDQLACNGLRFTQMRVTTSICMVSRATFFTGQHMARHGIRKFGVPLSSDQWRTTYPGLLREAGYWMGFVGKFGVGKADPKQFDFLKSYEGVHWTKDEQGKKIHVTERNARDSLTFLRERPKDRPFCLSVSYFAVHAEDRAPEQYLPQPWSEKFYAAAKIPVPKTATPEHTKRLPAFLSSDKNEGRIRWKKRFDTPEKFQEYMKNYYRLATELDEAVGRLIAELKKQGVYENTLIVFSGDNGYFHAEHGLADKWYPFEEALRVPLLVLDPRMPEPWRGKTHDARVLNIDLAPFLVTAGGLKVPATMQGADFSELYRFKEPPRWRETFYYQHPVVGSPDRIPQSEAVVRPDFIYTYWPDFQVEQLFDLVRDPYQEKDLAGEREYAMKKRELAEELKVLRQGAN